jgi:hypothetical protein
MDYVEVNGLGKVMILILSTKSCLVSLTTYVLRWFTT